MDILIMWDVFLALLAAAMAFVIYHEVCDQLSRGNTPRILSLRLRWWLWNVLFERAPDSWNDWLNDVLCPSTEELNELDRLDGIPPLPPPACKSDADVVK